jgi:serine/threonine-protein kinase RCK2
VMAHQAHQVPGGDAFSAADLDNRNRGAQAHNAAAHQAEKHQKKGNKKIDQEELKRIVAEENESKGKLPRYPGLERWQLVEKMGDGAFSNVYRARDLDGEVGEVAIKVVRKFEMNSNQVSIWHDRVNISLAFLLHQLSSVFEKTSCQHLWVT